MYKAYCAYLWVPRVELLFSLDSSHVRRGVDVYK
jgi:hypothetical protein